MAQVTKISSQGKVKIKNYDGKEDFMAREKIRQETKSNGKAKWLWTMPHHQSYLAPSWQPTQDE